MKTKDADQLLASIFAKQKEGRIFIISGPSGVGKTAACQAVLQRIPNLIYSVSYTTRLRRSQEVDGKDYFFVSRETFQHMIRGGEFLEWAQVHSKLYGTSQKKIRGEIASGNSVILDIDMQGAEQIRNIDKRFCSIFLLPPSMEILYGRLVKRNSESVEEIKNRIDMAYHEIQHYFHYDYIVVNTEFDKMINQLEAIIRTEFHRVI